MILRKPYAFFIRMFKPIHLVIGLLIGILVSTEGRMYGFLNRNANTSLNLIGQNLKSEYITLSLYVIPIVVILLFMGIFVIMFYKKKPVTFYVAGIISLIAVIIINAYATAFFSELNEAIVAIKYVKLTRDLSLIAMIIEIVLLVFVLIRGAGVNIQKFNFDSDISKIDIKDSDNEEFEVNVSLNIDKAKRDRNKRIRYLKYAYAENKLKVNIAIGVIVFLLVVVSFVLFNKRTRIFSEKQSVGTIVAVPTPFLRYHYPRWR